MKRLALILSIGIPVLFADCSKDDSEPQKLGSKEFSLHSVDKPEVQGKVTFYERKDGSTDVVLQLNGSSTDIHPGFIYNGKESAGGSVAITLDPIECDCQSSTTTVTKLDNGTAITYDALKAFNGHVKIHQSASELQTVIARGNIGINAQ